VKVALFWDVDGTLLSTARAGVFSLEDALEQVTGVRADLRSMATAGLTDYAIAQEALRRAGVPAEDATVREYLRVHGDQLEHYLSRREGHVMPNVREILDDLRPREDVRSYLLTGNIEAGARAKLAHYGLLEFFDGGGAFCVGPGDREEIARRALPLADGARLTWVIGDTPADVACGKAIGANTLGVATGAYDRDALAAAEATEVVDELPEPPSFRELIGV
jgi:phosphoglycolate phosphatase